MSKRPETFNEACADFQRAMRELRDALIELLHVKQILRGMTRGLLWFTRVKE